MHDSLTGIGSIGEFHTSSPSADQPISGRPSCDGSNTCVGGDDENRRKGIEDKAAALLLALNARAFKKTLAGESGKTTSVPRGQSEAFGYVASATAREWERVVWEAVKGLENDVLNSVEEAVEIYEVFREVNYYFVKLNYYFVKFCRKETVRIHKMSILIYKSSHVRSFPAQYVPRLLPMSSSLSLSLRLPPALSPPCLRVSLPLSSSLHGL